MKHVCKGCMDGVEQDLDSKFPKYTVLGGILGTFAGLFVGPLVLIPAALISGAVIDKIRCDLCGTQDDVFEVMEQVADERYRRVPLKQFEDPNPLDDQIWIDQTKQEFYFDETEGQVIEAQDPDVSFDVGEGLDVGFDSGFDTGFGDGGGE